eukprot:3965710-Alexandrium_andersonii.AAC.1
MSAGPKSHGHPHTVLKAVRASGVCQHSRDPCTPCLCRMRHSTAHSRHPHTRPAPVARGA